MDILTFRFPIHVWTSFRSTSHSLTLRGFCSILARNGFPLPAWILDLCAALLNIPAWIFGHRFPLSTDKDIDLAEWYVRKYLRAQRRKEKIDGRLLTYFTGIVARINHENGRENYLDLSFFGLTGNLKEEAEYEYPFAYSMWCRKRY